MTLFSGQNFKTPPCTRSNLLHILRKLVFLWVSLFSFIAQVSALTTIDFQWEAGLDTLSGLAYSSERSRITKPYDCLLIRDDDAILKSKIEFVGYPQFLGRRNIMFGLLRAKSSQNDENGQPTTMICAPIFDINLISFGVPSVTVIPPCRSNTYSKKSCNDEKQTRQQHYSVLAKIPVVGGLLVCNTNKDRTELKTKRQKMDMGNKYGEIWLQVTLPQRDRAAREQNGYADIEIETRLVDYRPSIAGIPPIGSVRRLLYRHTQSYLHAYVMWRFHNHCYKNILCNK